MYTLHVSMVCMGIGGDSPSLCPKVNFHSIPLEPCSSEMYGTSEYRQEIGGENRRGGGGEEDDGRGGGKETPSWTLLTSHFSLQFPSPLCPPPFSRVIKELLQTSWPVLWVVFSGKEGGVSLELLPPHQEAFKWSFLKAQIFGGRSHRHFLSGHFKAVTRSCIYLQAYVSRGQRKITFQ